MTRPEAHAAIRGPVGDRRLERLDELTARLSILAGEPLSLRSGPDGWGQDVSTVGKGVALAGGSAKTRAIAAGVLADALDSHEELTSLCAEIAERYEEASLVYRLSDRLGAVMGEAEIAKLVLAGAAEVLGAGSAELWLHRGPAVELAAAVPEAPADLQAARQGAFSALYEGRPWIREASEEHPSEIAVPLPDPGGDPIGVLVLRDRPAGRSYGSGEIKVLTTVAALTSAFVRNDRLASSARIADAKRREDEIARQIHSRLLPHAEPDVAGLDVAGACRAADTVGGDYYGYLELLDGGFGIVMADICGHGVGAALYMAVAKGVIQAESRRLAAPSDLLRQLNDTLTADFSRSDVFATAFITRFDTERGLLEYANGGHNPPFLFRRDRTTERLERGGLALGVMPNVLYQEESRRFGDGDVLLVHTDGLVEARNHAGEFYGTERIERRVAGMADMDAAGIRDAVLADLDAFTGDAPLRDDVTLVVVRGVARGER